MVMVVRTDLGMGKGKIAAQCSHAAVDLYDMLLERKDPKVKTWVCYCDITQSHTRTQWLCKTETIWRDESCS